MPAVITPNLAKYNFFAALCELSMPIGEPTDGPENGNFYKFALKMGNITQNQVSG